MAGYCEQSNKPSVPLKLEICW